VRDFTQSVLTTGDALLSAGWKATRLKSQTWIVIEALAHNVTRHGYEIAGYTR
jgi:hypothetical protein